MKRIGRALQSLVGVRSAVNLVVRSEGDHVVIRADNAGETVLHVRVIELRDGQPPLDEQQVVGVRDSIELRLSGEGKVR